MTRSRYDHPLLRGLAIIILAALLATLAACSDDGPGGLDERIDSALVGSYAAGAAETGGFGAIVFTADTASISRDLIEEGASIRLELRADGATAGRLFVPDIAVPDGSNDFEADLAGTWRVDDDVLTLDQPADTFLRDMPFVVEDDRLVGDERFGGVHVRVVLVRQEG